MKDQTNARASRQHPDHRHHSPFEGAAAKRVKVSTRSLSDPEDRHEVDLRPATDVLRGGASTDRWFVYLPDGTWIGEITRYTGSISTRIKGTRLRREGKPRTLWSYTGPWETSRGMASQSSRAVAIRALIEGNRNDIRG